MDQLVKIFVCVRKILREKDKVRNFSENVTRRAEFVILGSRVIQLQRKREKASMPLIWTFKAESLNYEDVSCVQISI